jgi:hypothetical protein
MPRITPMKAIIGHETPAIIQAFALDLYWHKFLYKVIPTNQIE